MRNSVGSLLGVVLLAVSACGAVSDEPTDSPDTGTTESDPTTDTSPTSATDPAPTNEPSSDPTETVSPSSDSTTVAGVIPPEEQSPAEATAVDGSMMVELPDDWRYAPELKTPYSVFGWTKIDATQNISVAPLGPWAQIGDPETYLQRLIDAGNLGDATATFEGDVTVDGYDGFWVSVTGPGYVANIYYVNVDGGIREITVNALHSQGLAEADRLVHTIDFL